VTSGPPAGADPAALRAELRLVEEELAELRRTAAELRRRIGERAEAPADEVDVTAMITAAEEQEALVTALSARREALLERLGGSGIEAQRE
jgi:hypothetical protein